MHGVSAGICVKWR